MKNIFFTVSFIYFVLDISCSSSNRIIYINKSNPTANIKLLIKSKPLPEDLMKYQMRLDSFLVNSSEKKKSFIALTHNDDNADYTISISIDSIYLISPDIQLQKLKIKDSIFNALKSREAHYDSTAKPLTDGEKTALLIVAGIFGGAMGVAQENLMLNNSGGYETPRPTLTHKDKKALKKITFNPSIIGNIKVTNKLTSDTIWQYKYILEDEYDKYVDYNEQVDMLIRWLIGKLRYTFSTPFISEGVEEKVKQK